MSSQRGALGALAAIACYTVDSEDSDNEDMEVDLDPVSLASHVIDDILNKVTGHLDIKLEIKEEPLDIKQEPEDYENIVVTPYVGWMTDSVGYRDPTTIKVEDDSSEEDSESDSDSSSTSDSSEDEKETKPIEEEPKTSNQPIKSKNEVGLSDLPPITDLHITVSEEECVKIGTIASCVQELVVIESLVGNPALDLDTVLFLDFGKRTLGQVFDVIGPVNQPLYCVRFNSVKHIQEKEVLPGMAVFYAPKTEHTSYVFLEQLMKMKISDASWANDEEPPPNFLDYSDDEEERKAKQEHKLERMKNAGASEEEVAAKRAKFTKGRNRNEAVGDRLPGAVDTNNRRDNKNNRNTNRGQAGANNTNSGGSNGSNGARRGNGLYGENNNPFYRRSRTYDPTENGPIRWGSAMPAGVPQVPNLSTPPPPRNTSSSQYSSGSSQSHNPPFGAAASPRQQQIYGQPSMYFQQPQQNQWSQQPPPPPQQQQNQWRNQRQQQQPAQNQWQNQQQQPAQNQWQNQQQQPAQNQWQNQQQQTAQQNQWQQPPPQQNRWQVQNERPQQNQWQQQAATVTVQTSSQQWQQSQQPQWQQQQQQTNNPRNENKGYWTEPPPPGV